MDIGTNILGANVNYNAELQGGDIGRMGFGRMYSEGGTDVIGTETSHATTRQPDGSHIYNSGRLQSGLTQSSNIGNDIHVYARYVGNTRKLKEQNKTASFIANATRGNLYKTSKIKPMGGAKITANTKGLNSLFKKLKKK